MKNQAKGIPADSKVVELTDPRHVGQGVEDGHLIEDVDVAAMVVDTLGHVHNLCGSARKQELGGCVRRARGLATRSGPALLPLPIAKASCFESSAKVERDGIEEDAGEDVATQVFPGRERAGAGMLDTDLQHHRGRATNTQRREATAVHCAVGPACYALGCGIQARREQRDSQKAEQHHGWRSLTHSSKHVSCQIEALVVGGTRGGYLRMGCLKEPWQQPGIVRVIEVILQQHRDVLLVQLVWCLGAVERGQLAV